MLTSHPDGLCPPLEQKAHMTAKLLDKSDSGHECGKQIPEWESSDSQDTG